MKARSPNGPRDMATSQIVDDLTPTRLLWALRLDWPAGDHEFGCPRLTEEAALHELIRVRAYWARGPMRPRLSIVRISGHDFDLHARARRGCRAPDCPTPTPTDAAP